MKEEVLQRSKAACLGAVILGICGCITSVVEAEGAFLMAVVAALVSGAVYVIGCIGKKQRCFITLGWAAGMGVFLKLNWDAIQAGALQFGNKIIQRINEYYRTSFSLRYQKENTEEMELMFLLIFLVSGMLEACFLWIKNKRVRNVVVCMVPLLCFLCVLMLGKPFSFSGVFWLLAAVFFGKALPLQKGKWKNIAVSLGVLLIAAGISLSPAARAWVEQNHMPWYKRQLKLEDKMLAFGEKYLNLNRFLAGGTQKSQSLSNQRPERSGREILRITVSKFPKNNIYLKGFIGEEYENGRWSAADTEDFSDFAADRGYSLEEYTRTIQNMPGKLVTESRNGSYEISIATKNVISGYTLMPYYGQLEENMEMSGDGAVKPTGEKEYTVQRLSGAEVDVSEKETKQWKSYQRYVREHDLSYPKEELERLESLVKDAKKSDLSSKEEVFEYLERYGEGEDTSIWRDMYSENNISLDGPTAGSTQYTMQELIVKCLLWYDTSYSLDLEEVPEGEEFAEYFLFQQKKGFCVHYATTGTLMFRMMGIPARYVSGYVVRPSDFERNEDGTYTAVVTDKSAHAWTEIFDGNTGFFPVEVTPAAAFEEEPETAERQQDAAEENSTQQTEKPDQQEEEPDQQGQQEEQNQQTEQNQQNGQEKNGQEQEEENQQAGADGTGNPGDGAGTGTGGQGESSGASGYNRIMEKVWQTVLNGVAIGAGAAILVLFVRLRRNYIIERKYRLFHQKNRSKGTRALGKEIYRILKVMGYGKQKNMTDSEYGLWLEQNLVLEQEMKWSEFVSLQQQAVFSDKEITRQQWQDVMHLLERMKVELTCGKSRKLILYWKYIKILS